MAEHQEIKGDNEASISPQPKQQENNLQAQPFDVEEWELHRNNHKRIGDEAFRKSDYQTAVTSYTLALSRSRPSHFVLKSLSGLPFQGREEPSLGRCKKMCCTEAKLCKGSFSDGECYVESGTVE